MDDEIAPDFSTVPDPHDPDYEAKVHAWLQGTYSSGWDDLKWASGSALHASAYGTSLAYKTYQKLSTQKLDPGEASFLIDINYKSAVLGPALGAVTLTAFTIESFLRLGYTVSVELSSGQARSARKGGFTKAIASQLTAFDQLPTSERIKRFASNAKVTISRSLSSRLDHLFQFRNSLAHDTPSLYTAGSGPQQVTKRGTRPRPVTFGPFEALTSGPRPVRLKHVLVAVAAHDDLVERSLEDSRLPGWADRVRSVDSAPGKAGIAILWERANPLSTLQELANAWENGPQALMTASNQAFFTFRERMVARAALKLLP